MEGISIFIFTTFLFYGLEFAFNIFVVWAIVKFIINLFRKNKTQKFFKDSVIYYNDINGNGSKYARQYNDITKDKLSKLNISDIDALKEYFYDIFYRFEVAYNNLDYSVMKMLSTKQLYQNYYTGISLDLKSGKKKIIEEIDRKQVIIYELDTTLIKQIASAMIEISYYNYTIDKNGHVVSGDRNKPAVEKFEVEFRKDFEREKVTHCPNCGAKLNGVRCDYCKAFVDNSEFVISSIRRIIDK